MVGEYKVALATAGFLFTLGACSLWSAGREGATIAPLSAEEIGRELIVPIAGVATSALVDSFGAARAGGRAHEGVDIMADEGTPVRAAARGTILKLHESARGGLTLYQADATGRLILCYAHLSAYAEELREGMAVEQGQVIAHVGETGNATRPHLHFEVLRAQAPGQWWSGAALNPHAALLAGRVEDEAARASVGVGR
jgi:murein DD-endopeptidase MepM/ murein hydrolase activator NlpD